MNNKLLHIWCRSGVAIIDRKNTIHSYKLTGSSSKRLHRAVSAKINSIRPYERPRLTLFAGGFEVEW